MCVNNNRKGLRKGIRKKSQKYAKADGDLDGNKEIDRIMKKSCRQTIIKDRHQTN